MKCCICGAPVSVDQARSFSVSIDAQRFATCSEDHRKQAHGNPRGCTLTSDTAVELIPL